MPVDIWKEVFLKDNPEPQHVELFMKLVLSGAKATLEEAARKVRYEELPDAVIVWRDPVPLVAVSALYAVGETDAKLKIVAVEPMPSLLSEVAAAIASSIGASVYPITYNVGYGRDRIADQLRKAIRIVRGAAIRIADISDAPAAIGVALHRAGVRSFTIVRRRGYEVLIERFSL